MSLRISRPASLGLLALFAAAPIFADATLPPTPFRFVPVTPCRVIDTRLPNLNITPVPQETRVVQVSGVCGVPAGARAYSLNVTAVPQSGFLGYLTIWPTAEERPYTSLLNSWSGHTVAGATILKAGSGGSVSIYTTHATHLVVDINGYFIDSTADLQFYPLPPCRVLDTRSPSNTLTGGATRRIDMLGTCGVPVAAQAYSLNFTVVAPQPLGYLTAWPAGDPQPFVSTLNAPLGGTVANAAIVKAGAGGGIDVYVTNHTELVLDINGYFAPPASGGLSLYINNVCRVLDTRPSQAALLVPPPTGTLGPPPLAAGVARDLEIPTGRCDVPRLGIPAVPVPVAYIFNVTVVPPASIGFLTLWPAGPARPTVSTLNSSQMGVAVSNMAIVQGGVSNNISVFSTDYTDLVLDISGYFAR